MPESDDSVISSSRLKGSDLTALETLLAQAFPSPRKLTTLVTQAELNLADTDPSGEMVDRWSEVVRACHAREEQEDCLTKLIDNVQRRLKGTDHGRELAQLLSRVQQREASELLKTAASAFTALSDNIDRLRNLDDPTQSAGLASDIRADALTLWRLLGDNVGAATLTVGVSLVPESSQEVRDLIVSACMELVSAVDRLRGRIRMGRGALDTSGPILRDTYEDVLQATYRLDSVIDARDLAIRRGIHLVQLIQQQLPLTAAPPRS